MPLDPQMKALLDAMAKANAPAFHTLTPVEARRSMAGRAVAGDAEPIERVEDRAIPGPGGPLPIRIYTPSGAGPFAALIYFHGGGWVLGDIAMTDLPCRMLANASGCVVVSVEYRLAPEHKFPAAPEDCYAATRWVSDNAAALNLNPQRIAVGAVSEVTGERALQALGQVVLRARQPVIKKEHGALPQRRGERCDPRRDAQAQL